MSREVPSHLVGWFRHLGISSVVETNELQTGVIVHQILSKIGVCRISEVIHENTAVNRMLNWNNLSIQLTSINIHLTPDQKANIINGSIQSIFELINSVREYYVSAFPEYIEEQNHMEIDAENDISKASSLLELLVLVIMKHFSIGAKEAAALLAQDSKYLAHVLTKGLKGEFQPVQQFFSTLCEHSVILSKLCKHPENESFFLQAIKPALISKSLSVSSLALSLLDSYTMSVNHKFRILQDHLINTIILSMRRHPALTNQLVTFLIRSSEYNKSLFSLIREHGSQTEFQNIFLEIWNQSQYSGKLSNVLEMRGSKQIISVCITNATDAETAISSLKLLSSISLYPQYFSISPDQGRRLLKNFQQISFNQKEQAIRFLSQSFALLEVLGKQHSKIAPSFYKYLVSRYKNPTPHEQSSFFIGHFNHIIQQFPTIPFEPIVQAIFQRQQHNSLHISHVELNFLEKLVDKNTLQMKIVIIIFNIVARVLVDDLQLSDLCTDILCKIITKTKTQNTIVDMITKLTKITLALNYTHSRKLHSKKKSVHSESDEQSMKKTDAVQKFLIRVLNLKNRQINSHIEPLLAYSIIQLNAVSEEATLGLRKVLAVLGNSNVIVKNYEEQIERLDQEAKKKELKRAKSRPSRLSLSPKQQKKQLGELKLNQKSSKSLLRKSSKHLYRSQQGITFTAIKGLEKYHQAYKKKVQKVESLHQIQKQQVQREEVLKKIFQKKMLDKGVEIKKIKTHQIIHEFGVKEKELNEDKVRGKIELPYYDPENEEDSDIKALQNLMKRFQRVIKVYYSAYSGLHKPKSTKLFDEIAEKGSLLYSSSLWKLLRDHTLDEFITVKEMQYISKRINARLKKEFDDATILDYEGFEQFIIQASYVMFTRPPLDLRGHPIAQMVRETLSRLKQYAAQNRIDQELFVDPESIFYNQTEAVKELNKKLRINPNYILPEGYKKIIEKKITYSHQILGNLSIQQKIAYEIIDELLFDTFDINLIEPHSRVQKVAKARPVLYFNQRQEGEVNSEKVSVFLKKEVAKFPIKDRDIAKQSAQAIHQILTAVELGHQKVGQKHYNKALREKLEKEEEIRRKQEHQTKKWSQRNETIKQQLRYLQTEKQRQRRQEQKKKHLQKLRQEHQKERRKLQEEELKRKVTQYQKKKRQQEKRRQQLQEERKRQQKEQFQRKKQEIYETKLWIQQVKQERQEEQKRRREQQQQEAKARDEQERRKYEEEMRIKKEKIEEYRLKKSQIKSSKLDSSKKI